MKITKKYRVTLCAYKKKLQENQGYLPGNETSKVFDKKPKDYDILKWLVETLHSDMRDAFEEVRVEYEEFWDVTEFKVEKFEDNIAGMLDEPDFPGEPE